MNADETPGEHCSSPVISPAAGGKACSATVAARSLLRDRRRARCPPNTSAFDELDKSLGGAAPSERLLSGRAC